MIGLVALGLQKPHRAILNVRLAVALRQVAKVLASRACKHALSANR